MKTILKFTSAAFVFIATCNALAKTSSEPTPSENHKFHISASAQYRCYAGYDGKKVTDERTNENCDNKTFKTKIIDKLVSIKIEDEPDPENSKALAGSWSESFQFKGRKFVIAMTVFKDSSTSPYRVRIVTKDDEPTARETVIYSQTKTIPEMNALSIEYNSAGKKEEITYRTDIQGQQ